MGLLYHYSFPLEAEATPGPYCGRKDYVNEKFQCHMGNRTRDPTACSTVPQTTAPLRTPVNGTMNCKKMYYLLNQWNMSKTC
jgi:hypothetical protein